MTERLDFAPVRLPTAMLVELVIRIALAIFLVGVGLTDQDLGLVLVLCCLAALYHLSVAVSLASCRIPSATHLTLDRTGLTLRRLWRDQNVAWTSVLGVAVQTAKPLSAQRAWALLTLGDRKGPTGSLAIPDVFMPSRHELVAEMERLRQGGG